MIKRELKINLKNLIIWITVMTLILILMFSVYPSIAEGSNGMNINDLIQVMPQNLIAAFNIDLVDMSSVTGFFQSEGLVILMLVYAIYAGQLGSTILLKEESDKTIEFLYSKPINKSDIITPKLIAGIIYIIIFIIVINLVLATGLLINDESIKQVLLLNTSMILPSVSIFTLTLLISTFFTKTKQTSAMSFGLVFLSYFIQIFSNFSDKIEWLKYFTVFTLSDTRNLVANNTFDGINIIIFIVLNILLIFLIYINYNRKEYNN